ncbi:casparian strip membrane protein 4-like [Populus alba x Populus x berolinensis]|nr:casparian strip membrane protein 4-like [Populus alba x Populus x berolinensis]
MAFDVTSFLSLGQEAKADTKGKGFAGAPNPTTVPTKDAQHPRKRWRKGVAIFDLVLEVMFLKIQKIKIKKKKKFFVVANAIASEPLALLHSRTKPPPCPL